MQNRWKEGEVFSTYLERNKIPVTLLKHISSEDLQYLSEIQSGERFYELKEDGRLMQVLIPVGEEMQIHLFRDIRGEKFHFDITPIVCRELTDTVSFAIEKGLYEDINRWTKNPRLGYLLKRYYGKTVNFKTLHKGDRLSLIYTQRSRLGKPYGAPKIKASLIRSKGKDRFIFADKDNTYYDDVTKDIAYTIKKRIRTNASRSFVNPVRKMRITSKFTYKRWHPILKRYRPHLGIDIGAKRGTNIYATHAGKVIYAGWMGGYGKVVKIKHSGGFVSLYAHQSRLAVKKGQYVKRGQVIGHVGSTGRSTAPHLHFGLYKNAKAVNPMQYIERKALSEKRIEIKKITKHKIVAIPEAKKYKRRMLEMIEKNPSAFRWETYVKPYNQIQERSRYEERHQAL
jgi:murein DD-endopeptidase MepM/ murein hydrolase activator NlpD